MLQNNLPQQQSLISKLSDPQLNQELSNPSGIAPTYLVMAEMQKRQQMRTAGMGSGANSGSIRQQMMMQAAKQPAQVMPEAAPEANVQQQNPVAGPNMVPNGQTAMGGGIPSLTQMNRVPGQSQRMPIAYNPQGFANGGIVQRYDDGGPVDVDGVAVVGGGKPVLATGPDQPYTGWGINYTNDGANLPSTNAYNTKAGDLVGSNLAGWGIQYPGTFQDNIKVATQTLGGDAAYASPYNNAIAGYAQQQGMNINPVAMALMRAGHAMTAAPNGSFGSALTAGMDAGAGAYNDAQAQQRAIQDKLIQAQTQQGVAVNQGRLAAANLANTITGQGNGLYEAGINAASPIARQAVGLPLQYKTAQDQADQWAAQNANEASRIGIEGQNAGTAAKTATDTNQYRIDEDVNKTYRTTYTSALGDYFKQKNIDPSLATQSQSAGAQAYASTVAKNASDQARIIHGQNPTVLAYDKNGNPIKTNNGTR